MQPSGIASIAARVEIGDDQDSGVARSSRAAIEARRDKPQCERAANETRLAVAQRNGAAHPYVAQAFLEEDRSEGGGGNTGQGFDDLGIEGKRCDCHSNVPAMWNSDQMLAAKWSNQ
jgi:hypothetical protein